MCGLKFIDDRDSQKDAAAGDGQSAEQRMKNEDGANKQGDPRQIENRKCDPRAQRIPYRVNVLRRAGHIFAF
mgnify:CR=1 FL=1